MLPSLHPAARDRGAFSSTGRRRLFFAAAVFLLTLGAWLRVYHLGVRSLWFDEAVTANISRGTFAEVLQQTRAIGSAPVVHPYILYLVERVSHGPVAVRAPSVLASFLAILLTLAMVRVQVRPSAALLSAAILAISTSQIRYAQEVREYSLSILLASALIFCLLRWENGTFQKGHPALLYVALFLAPLVQYGLVLLGCGLLITIILRIWLSPDTRFRVAHFLTASIVLGAGVLVSFFLTLRYQFEPGRGQEYLTGHYFDLGIQSRMLHFIATNSLDLIDYVSPGRVITILLAVAGLLYCVAQLLARKFEPLTLLVFTAFAITIAASLIKIYPYGGVRQCLFLTPLLTLFAGVILAELLQWLDQIPPQFAAALCILVLLFAGYRAMRAPWADGPLKTIQTAPTYLALLLAPCVAIALVGAWRRFRGFRRHIAALGLVTLILLSGYRSLRGQWPYKEFEDIRGVLQELSSAREHGDSVYVYHGATPAVRFYLNGKDQGFFYGEFHADGPQEYVRELRGWIQRRSDRTWLVFSHLQSRRNLSEERLLLACLQPSWSVERIATAEQAELYFARRQRF